MIYALDTNIVIHYLRDEQNTHKRFDNAISRGDNIVIPKIVHYEIMRGFRILHAPNKEAAYKVLIGASDYCDIAEMDAYCWERAELIYENLYHKRFTVGELDILIAAICLENNYTLVTDNVRHFENIDGVIIENWVTED